MDIHIDKKMAVAIIVSLILGGAIGAVAGFAGAMEEGDHGERHGMKSHDERMGYDDQSDGEIGDDQGGVPNSDEQQSAATNTPASVQGAVPAAAVPAKVK